MGLVALLVGAAVGVLAIGAVLPADVAMGLGSGISRSLSLDSLTMNNCIPYMIYS